ncbi:hypothetical protein PCC7424_0832 [Gloeothece citriformis PCC 7424]|uniref:Uncharacterized protein n=1 Tax=Gloeothece citriformis (strain PCC 7424) TaxID=65393 RepID=B7KH79_GLOC7|nr:hypothetical protein [Gloeothece citriformis]ACK69288.1 hypothetical protein PCC7424_0832 [Gloeothece citriformis PCC 7424]
MNKLIFTLTGIIALATTINLGFGLSAASQVSREEEPEIFQEDETDISNDEIDSQRQRDNYRWIMNPSYPNRIEQNRNYPSNYDENRSQRQRNYYERIMQPYHPRNNLERNSNTYSPSRRDLSSRYRYNSSGRRDYRYDYRNR